MSICYNYFVRVNATLKPTFTIKVTFIILIFGTGLLYDVDFMVRGAEYEQNNTHVNRRYSAIHSDSCFSRARTILLTRLSLKNFCRMCPSLWMIGILIGQNKRP